MAKTEISELKHAIASYEKTDTKSSIRQIINTTGPLLLLWYAAYLSLAVSYLLTLLIAIVTAGFMVRMLSYSTIAVTNRSSRAA